MVIYRTFKCSDDFEDIWKQLITMRLDDNAKCRIHFVHTNGTQVSVTLAPRLLFHYKTIVIEN